MLRKIADLIYKKIYNLFYTDQWCIVIKHKLTGKIKIIQPPIDRFWADPMVLKENGNYYIYIEELEYRNNKGYISLFKLNEKELEPETIYHDILEKPYHLSFPYIFKYKGEYYMIPESNRNKSIDLYKIDLFPNKWVFVKSIFTDIIASDSVVLFHEEMWWLFTTVKDETKGLTALNNLQIFYTKDILHGSWTSHPLNPVVKGKSHSRSAGPIFLREGRIIRPSQNCKKRYGYSVVMNEIVTLTTDHYEERVIEEILPTIDRQLGIHTYVECGDLIVTDGIFSRSLFFNKKDTTKLNYKKEGLNTKNKYFISFPSSDAINPFIKILNEHLQKQGWQERKDSIWLKPFFLYKMRKEIQILYFHWPESIWRSSSQVMSLLKACAFVVFLSFTKKLGIKLVFSGHNVMPHYKPGNKRLEYFMRQWILKKFDLIIVHAYNAKKDFQKRFEVQSEKYVLGVHGLYDEHYRFTCSMKEARIKLEVPLDQRIIMLHYNHNAYKGSKTFLMSWVEEGISDFLMIIGNPPRDIIDIVKEHGNYIIIPNDTLDNSFMSDEKLIQSVIAADFIALPYESITTSGAYFLAISYDKPVIAPDLSFFKLHTTPKTALLYDANTRKIAGVFAQIHNGWVIDQEELSRLKKSFDWNESSKHIAQAFDQIIAYA